ncbi:MAG: hypothetical protein ACYS8W_18340, partial [Planctomycetota bacterium]
MGGSGYVGLAPQFIELEVKYNGKPMKVTCPCNEKYYGGLCIDRGGGTGYPLYLQSWCKTLEKGDYTVKLKYTPPPRTPGGKKITVESNEISFSIPRREKISKNVSEAALRALPKIKELLSSDDEKLILKACLELKNISSGEGKKVEPELNRILDNPQEDYKKTFPVIDVLHYYENINWYKLWDKPPSENPNRDINLCLFQLNNKFPGGYSPPEAAERLARLGDLRAVP